jgi:hypothetical protein
MSSSEDKGVGIKGWLRGTVAFLYGKMKMFEEMRREYKAWVQLLQVSDPLVETYARVNIAYLEDDKETVRKILPELEAHFGEEEKSHLAMGIARHYFRLGENDKGFEWLERSYSRRESWLLWVTVDPDFDGIRTDPRYLDLLKRLGLG